MRVASPYFGPDMRFHARSGATSSTRLITHQMLPNGSRTRPPRSPHALPAASVITRAPCVTATAMAASASGTWTRSSEGITGRSGRRSKAGTTVSPTRISPWPMVPSSTGTRAGSSPPNAAVMQSSRAPVSSVTTHGATLVHASGAVRPIGLVPSSGPSRRVDPRDPIGPVGTWIDRARAGRRPVPRRIVGALLSG
jgi:hypothetical protein